MASNLQGAVCTVGTCVDNVCAMLKCRRITILGATMMTGFTTPVLLVPAEGANTIINPISVTINFIRNPTGTTCQIFPAYLQYGSTGGNTAIAATGVSNMYNGFNTSCFVSMPMGNSFSWGGFAPLEYDPSPSSTLINAPLYITTTGDTPGGSDPMTGSFVIDIIYSVVQVGAQT